MQNQGQGRAYVNVIVPARDEEEHVAKCLASLISQDYPNELYDITLVDNLSVDRTSEIGREYGVKVLSCDGSTIGQVRNYGVRNTEGDVIAFIDADCVAAKDWLSRCVPLVLETGDIGAVGGDAVLRDDANWLERGWILSMSHSEKESFTLNGASMVFERAAFEDVGGFREDVNANEDTLFSNSLEHEGKKVIWSAFADVKHYGYPRTIPEFFKRQFWLASSYIRSNSGWLDKTFLFSVISLVALLLTCLFLILGLYHLLFWSVLLFLVGPMLFSIKKLYVAERPLPISVVPLVFVQSILYFVARVAGLTFSLTQREYRRSKRY